MAALGTSVGVTPFIKGVPPLGWGSVQAKALVSAMATAGNSFLVTCCSALEAEFPGRLS